MIVRVVLDSHRGIGHCSSALDSKRRIATAQDLEWLADFVVAAQWAREQGYELTEVRDASGRSVSLRQAQKPSQAPPQGAKK